VSQTNAFSRLSLEAVDFSEILITFNQFTCCHIPKDTINFRTVFSWIYFLLLRDMVIVSSVGNATPKGIQCFGIALITRKAFKSISLQYLRLIYGEKSEGIFFMRKSQPKLFSL
jgi:hypothetical protein